MRMLRTFGPALKLLVTAALLFLVFRSVEFGRVRTQLQNLEFARAAMLLLACWAAQLVCAQRWRLFASALGLDGSFRTFAEFYFVGMFLNIGLPSLVGGDLAKAYLLSRKTGAAVQRALASTVQDRGTGLAALLTFGCVAAALQPLFWRGISLATLYVASLTAISAVFLILLYRLSIPGLQNLLSRPMLRAPADFLATVVHTHLPARNIAGIAILSAINSALVVWIVQQMCAAAAHPVSLLPICVLVPLVEVLTSLPISIAGLGIREWAYIEALALLGIPRDAALTIALALSALVVLRNLGGAFFVPAGLSILRQKHNV